MLAEEMLLAVEEAMLPAPQLQVALQLAV